MSLKIHTYNDTPYVFQYRCSEVSGFSNNGRSFLPLLFDGVRYDRGINLGIEGHDTAFKVLCRLDRQQDML